MLECQSNHEMIAGIRRGYLIQRFDLFNTECFHKLTLHTYNPSIVKCSQSHFQAIGSKILVFGIVSRMRRGSLNPCFSQQEHYRPRPESASKATPVLNRRNLIYTNLIDIFSTEYHQSGTKHRL